MSIFWKIVLVFYIWGWIFLALSFPCSIFPPFGSIFNILLAPIIGLFFAIAGPQYSIPYFASAFILLYWWEKRKRMVKENDF